jgi:hypothetical protein
MTPFGSQQAIYEVRPALRDRGFAILVINSGL